MHSNARETWVRRKRSIPFIFICCTVLAGGLAAQTRSIGPTGPEPGATDPVGSPGHLTLFPDDELVSFSPDGPNGTINTRSYQTDTNTSLSLANASVLLQGGTPNPIVASSGRVIQPDRDTLVYAYRVLGTNLISLNTLYQQQSASFTLSPLADRTSTFGADEMAVAVGDLDKATDSQFNYHDEVAAAYATAGNSIRLTVLNYTSGNPQDASIDTIEPDSYEVIPSDNPLSIAIGDFDNDGNNEIALAYVCSTGITVTTYRYTSDGKGSGSLQQASSTLISTPNFFSAGSSGLSATIHPSPLATVSLQTGDFHGVGFDELAIGYAAGGIGKTDGPFKIQLGASEAIFTVLKFDSNLQATASGASAQTPAVRVKGPVPPVRVELASGQFLFDPTSPAKYPFGQHQLAIAWNNLSNDLIGNTTADEIDIRAYALAGDFTIAPIGNTLQLQTGATPQFSLVAGGFTGNANIHSPTASLAVSAWNSGDSQGVYEIQTIAIGSGGLSFADLRTFATGPVDPLQRLPLVASDLDGKSVYLGAPAYITIENAISTDYIIEEPPKHSFWDGTQINTVTNYDSNHVSFTYSNTSKSSSTSTDHTNWTIGGSAEVSAGATVGVDEDAIIAKTKEQASIDVTAKGSYEYNKNKTSYNSSYGQRVFTIGSTTDHDDYIYGRVKTIDVWRYRIYGISNPDPNTNNFYDIMLPGPVIPVYGGGLGFDWYQPIHENGNILTYPQLFDAGNPTSNLPPDLGPFTDSDGKQVLGPIVPIAQWAFDGTGGTQTLDLSSGGGSGNTTDYSNTLAESLDVKAAASASVEVAGVSGEARASGDIEFHNSNSWGTASTSDTQTSTDLTLSMSKGSQDSTRSYVFDPITYITQDGTFKMSFAVPNPADSGSNPDGANFWASIYGVNPDPALNLPNRLSPSYSDSTETQNGWTPNTVSTRKQMRGLFFRNATLNPVNNDYDDLSKAITIGDQVRIEARIYNESTNYGADNITVRFQKIPYDGGNDNEICGDYAPINAGLPGGQICPAAARTDIGQTVVAHLNPLQFTCLSGTDDPAATGCDNHPVFINWNTAGDNIAGGSGEYRIYVVLQPESANQLYGGDGTPMKISNVVNGNASTPIKITTASPHGLHTGDWVTVGGTGLELRTDTNYIFQVTYIDDLSFSLNGTADVAGTYSGTGSVTPLNPGENDEGYRKLDIQNASLEGTRGKYDDFLARKSMRAIDYRTRKLTPGSVDAYLHEPLRIRVGVFSSIAHPQGTNLLLFDGNPAEGAAAIASQLVHPGNNSGKGTHIWFSWTPTTTGVHHLYVELLETTPDVKLGNNVSSLDVDVLRKGDVNGDGQINRADLTEILENVGQHASQSACGPACDLNGDGIISVLDVRKLVLICGAACGAK